MSHEIDSDAQAEIHVPSILAKGEREVLEQLAPFSLLVTVTVGIISIIASATWPDGAPAKSTLVSVAVCGVVIAIIAGVLCFYTIVTSPRSIRYYNAVITFSLILYTAPCVLSVSEYAWWRVFYLAIGVLVAGGIHLSLRYMTINVLIFWGMFWYMAYYYILPQRYFDPWPEIILTMVVSTCLSYIIMYMRRNAFLLMIKRYESMRNDSMRDSLTGVYNRKVLKSGILMHRLRSRNIQVFYSDIRGLKTVNDNFGHVVGDSVIRTVANSLTSVFRPEDVVIRVGGDEFVVISTSRNLNAQDVRQRVLEHSDPSESGIPASIWVPNISVGSAEVRDAEHVDIDTIIAQADQDMYNQRDPSDLNH